MSEDSIFKVELRKDVNVVKRDSLFVSVLFTCLFLVKGRIGIESFWCL